MRCRNLAVLLVFLGIVPLLPSCPARAGVLYVRSAAPGPELDGRSWQTAFPKVQAALAAAIPGDEIWASEGIYPENLTWTDGVALLGGFAGTESERDGRDPRAHPTIVDGGGKAPALTVPAGAMSEANLLDGLTFRNGLGTSRPPYGTHGGGILVLGGSLRVRACTLEANRADYGAGLYAEDARLECEGTRVQDNAGTGLEMVRGSARITACTVRRQENYGILAQLTDVRVQDSTIAENGLDGVLCLGGIGWIEGNTCAGNAYSGIATDAYGSFTIRRNIVRDNRSDSSAVEIRSTTNGMADAVDVSDNLISGNGAGIKVTIYNGTTVRISNNTIVSNDGAGLQSGLSTGGGGRSEWRNNVVAFNGRSPSGYVHVFHNNCVFGNLEPPDSYWRAEDEQGTVAADPMLANLAMGDIHLRLESPCREAGAELPPGGTSTDLDGQPRVQGGRVDIGADESDGTAPPGTSRVLRVQADGDDARDGASWETALKTVGRAIHLAAEAGGAEVWVASGTYTETIVLPSYVYLYGGFAGTETRRENRDWLRNKTILDGAARTSVVTVQSSGMRVTCLDGFTIRNGFRKGQGGGGVACLSGSTVVRNNVVRDNQAWNESVMGIGGGGISAGSHSLVVGNLVTGNVAMRGGGLYLSNWAIAANNIVTRNSTRTNDTDGAGVYADRHDVWLVNNTIAGNHGAGVSFSGRVVMVNNIVANNSTGVSAYADLYDPPEFRNNCFFGNTRGWSHLPSAVGQNGNIGADPRFVDAAQGDYRLLLHSPCRDAGSDTAPDTGDLDFWGQPRLAGPRVDIGAEEVPASGVLTRRESLSVLAIAAGLGAAQAADVPRLDTAEADGHVSLLDAVAIARRLAGLTP